jgi:DNA-binding transcriptional ArsR family regulator
MISLHWDTGTAYDFILSLFVLHFPAEFGLRRTWAAGVRQRLSPVSREFLERFFSFASPPLTWLASLPAPKDAAVVLRTLANLSPLDRLAAFTITPDMPARTNQVLLGIAGRGAWSEEEQDFLSSDYLVRGMPLKPAGLAALLKTWAVAGSSSGMLLAALREYQQVFFAEEENRIRPALEDGLLRAQEMAGHMSVEALIEVLSRGVRLETLGIINDLTLAPSYWTMPLVFVNVLRTGEALMVFGTRPEASSQDLEIESVAPGAGASDPLVLALKALGDPTRLRILRYLSDAPLTPTELARRLRLRTPTVVHHLRLLRLAGLVQVLIGAENERRYAARLETLQNIHASLQDFINHRN